MTWGYIQPEAKEALAVVKQMYDEGLIDPEFVVKDVANMETDVTTGKIGMMYQMNWGTWHPFNLVYQNDGVITRPYSIPGAEGYEVKIGVNSPQVGEYFAVNASCEHPEAMIKIVNLYNYLCYESTDPNDFATYWENEQSNFCPIYVIVPNELYAVDILDALESGDESGLTTAEKPFYQYVVDFDSGANTDSNAFGTWGQMNPQGSMAIDLQAQADGQLVTNVMAGTLPETWQQNASVLQDMTVQAYTDIILGNQPMESFDQFVTEWLNAGGQATLDELEELYPQ